VVGARGILFDPDGNHEVKSIWRFEEAINNHLKALSLYQGI
jgi:hypothetical protein